MADATDASDAKQRSFEEIREHPKVRACAYPLSRGDYNAGR